MQKQSILIYCCLPILLLISVVSAAQNCTVNAGINEKICPGDAFVLKGKMNGQVAVTASWTQVGGPAVTIGAPVITGTGPYDINATVTGYSTGNSYTFRLSGKCVDGSLIYQEVTYTVLAATVANAVSMNICPGDNTATLSANAPGAGETGVWSIVGAEHGINIDNVNLYNSTIDAPTTESGITNLKWTINNSNGCTSAKDITITNGGGVTPVSAGSQQDLGSCYNLTQATRLGASYGGDNFNGQQGTWEMVSGPSQATFDNIHVNDTWVRNLVEGAYMLRWTVSGPCVNGSALVKITVAAPLKGITNAGNSIQTFCDARTTAVLSGPVPGYTDETISWFRVSGQGTVTNPSSTTTTVTGLHGSLPSVFQYEIRSANGCVSTGSYTINYTTPPSIALAAPATAPLAVDCGASEITVPFLTTGGDRSQWLLISAPAGAAIISTAGTEYQTTGSPLKLSGLNKIGTYIIRLRRTTNDGAGGCSDAYLDVPVVVSLKPTEANSGTQQVLACNVFNTNLAANVPVTGSGSWSLVSSPDGAPGVTITDKTDPTTAIANLVNGEYHFRWIITGNSGCPDEQSDVLVKVSSTTPAQASAGTDHAVCTVSPIKLSGNAAGLNELGTWSLVSGGAATFSDIHDPKALVTGLAENTAYTFRWTITNSCGSTHADVTLTTDSRTGPKQAVAEINGLPSLACLSPSTTMIDLLGNAPEALKESATWNFISGPMTPTITIPNPAEQHKATVTNLASNGTYLFTYALSTSPDNGCAITEDTVTITKSAATTVASVLANTLTVCGTTLISLGGNTPANTSETGIWSQISGPGGVVITNTASPTTSLTGLTDGRYTFRWTINNGACASTFADVQLSAGTPPVVATISNMTNFSHPLCDVTSSTTYSLPGNNVSPSSGLWTQVSGPNNLGFSSYTANNAVLSNLRTGTYVLNWTSSTGFVCPVNTATITLSVTERAKASVSSQALCNATTVDLRGNEGSVGTWTKESGPGTPVITGSLSNYATVTGLIPGSYQFKYTIAAAGSCTTTSSTQTIVISAPPSPAIIQTVNGAGITANEVTKCISSSTTTSFALVASAITNPSVGAWSILSKPLGSAASFSTLTNTTTNFNNVSPGSYLLSWNVSNGSCGTNQDIVRLIVNTDPTQATATDQTGLCNGTITLNGNTPVSGIGTWTYVSGNSDASIIDQPNSPTSKLINAPIGTHKLRWTITTGCGSSFVEVNINVVSTPTAIADAGNAQEICLSSATSATLAATAANTATGESGLWSIISAPGGSTATFDNASNAAAILSPLKAGDYSLQWALTKGACTSTDNVLIKVNAAPSAADAGLGQNICLYSPVVLAAVVPTVGQGTWTVFSKPGGSATPVFSNVNANDATVTSLEAGTYVFRWTVTNGNCAPANNFNDVSIVIVPPPTPAIAGANQVICKDLTATLAGNVAVSGAGTWSLISGTGPVITNTASPTTTITNLSTPGIYLFQWTINSACGSSSSTMMLTVQDGPGNNTIGAAPTICYNTSATLAASAPTGGDGSNYTYRWQRSATDVDAAYVDISNTNGQNLSYGALTTSTWFRRIVTSGVCGLSNTSAGVQVIVRAPITGNDFNTLTAGNGSTVLCTPGDPAALTDKGITLSGGGGPSYSVQWQRSTDATNYSNIAFATSLSYDPVTETNASVSSNLNVWYRRLITSNSSCIDTSSTVQQIVVQPALVNNIGSPQTICETATPANLTSTATVTGGDGNNYTFLWQRQVNGGGYSSATGTNNVANYTPGSLAAVSSATTTYDFRRQLSSGACAVVTSPVITITVNPAITNNTITAPMTATLCSADNPGAFTGTAPSGGNGSYLYKWEQATSSDFATSLATVVPATSTAQNYDPPALSVPSTTTYYYRRTVTSGGCSNQSPEAHIVIQGPLANNIIGTAKIICGTSADAGTLTGTLSTGGSGTMSYQWQSSTTNASTGFSDIGGATAQNYVAGTINQTTWYKRTVTSGACTTPLTSANTITVTLNTFASTSEITASSLTAPTVVYGNNSIVTPLAPGVISPVFTYYVQADKGGVPSPVVTNAGSFVTIGTNGATFSKGHLGVGTNNTLYYITVKGSNFCENQAAVAMSFPINPATLTVTADNKGKTYGDVNPALTFTGPTDFVYGENATSAVVTGGPVTVTTTAVTNSPVGPYALTLGNKTYSAPNYIFNYVDGTLTIAKKQLNITAVDQSKAYDATPFAGPNSVFYNGFITGEDENTPGLLTGTLGTLIHQPPHLLMQATTVLCQADITILPIIH